MKQSEFQRGSEQICVTGKNIRTSTKGDSHAAELKLASYITYFEGKWS